MWVPALRLLAVLQVAGSSSAALTVLPVAVSSEMTYFEVPILIVTCVVYGFAFVSGIWLWNLERRGCRVAALVHLVQAPVISSSPLTYQFVFGFGVTVIFAGSDSVVVSDFGSKSFLLIWSEVSDFLIGINVWACAVFVFLWHRGQSVRAVA